MPEPSLLILGYSEASMFLRGVAGRDVRAILSIHGQREFGVEAPGVAHRLDLSFDDVDVPEPGDVDALHRAAARRRWAAENGLREAPPTPADAAAIIAFAGRVRDASGVLLCHCGAGMSRAPAAALICLAVWRGAGREESCVRVVRALRPAATPHAGLVRFADELLGRGGTLLRAANGTT